MVCNVYLKTLHVRQSIIELYWDFLKKLTTYLTPQEILWDSKFVQSDYFAFNSSLPFVFEQSTTKAGRII
jgi:hypothetical protein